MISGFQWTCDQSAAEPCKPTLGKDSSARVRRARAGSSLHALPGVLLPIPEHRGPGAGIPRGREALTLHRWGLRIYLPFRLRAAPKLGGYKHHFKHRGVLPSLCLQNQHLGPWQRSPEVQASESTKGQTNQRTVVSRREGPPEPQLPDNSVLSTYSG